MEDKRLPLVFLLKIFKVRLDGTLSNLMRLKMSLLIVRGLD